MKKIYFLLILCSGLFAAAQCPTLIDANPQFCDLQSPQVSDLMATDNGAGVNWFETATSTTPLNPNTFLINNQRVFLDNAAGNCGTRQEVIVTVTGPPVGSNFQGLCINDGSRPVVGDLFATGNDVRWYDAAFGGNEIPLSATLVSGEVIYADQANPVTGCRTSRLFVQADVVVVSTPIGNQIQQFCDDPNNPSRISDLVTNGANRWYAGPGSVLPLDEDTILVDGEDYYATSIDLPCESIGRLRVVAQLESLNNAGSDAVLEICEDVLNTTGNISLFSNLNGSPDSNGVWAGDTTLSGGDLGLINAADLNFNNSPFTYTYTVSTSASCPPVTSTVTINVVQPLEAGLDASISLCEDSSPIDLFTLLGGTPDAGGTWSPSLASNSGIFNPAVDTEGDYTYTVGPTAACSAISTATISVSVEELPDAGISSSLEICSTDAAVDLISILGGTPDAGGTWSPRLSSGSGIFNPAIDSSNTYTYTVNPTAPCNIPATATVTVTVADPADAGLDASISLCEDSSPIDLFTLLGGTPDAGGTWSPSLASNSGIFNPAVDTEGDYTYTVGPTTACSAISTATISVSVEELPDAGISSSLEICSTDAAVDLISILGGTPDAGGTWSPRLSSGSGIFNPAIDSSNTYTYTVNPTAPCNIPATATVTVTVADPADAGLDASISLCEDSSPIDLFTLLGGTPDAGGTWSPSLASNSGIFNPAVDNEGDYTYTVGPTAACSAISTATISVSVEELPDAGISSSLEICSTDVAVDLISILGGTPDAGGTWSPRLSSGSGIFNPAIDSSNTYTYTVNPMAPCSIPATATVTVTVGDPADAGLDASISLCEDSSPIDLFTLLGGTPDAGGTWSPSLASNSGIFNPAVDTEGDYTYTVVSTNACTQISTATISVSVDTIPDAGTDGTIDLCIISNPIDLITVLGGTPDTGGTWSPPLSSGSGIFNPARDTAGVYTYTVTASPNSSCGNNDTATATVTVQPIPSAGLNNSLTICSDSNSVDLFNILGGSPDLGGSWNPPLNSGTGIFDPSVDTAGRYTYSIFSGAPCNITASASIIVTVETAPNSGDDGQIELCSNDVPVDLFTVLGGTPDLGGTWTPALNSSTGVFDPSVDSPGVYTYTVQPIGSCSNPSTSTVTVSIVNLPNAGIDNSIDICEDNARIDLFTVLGGTPDIGGTWSPPLSSGGGTFNPAVDSSGIYTYTVSATAPCSGSDSAQVTVNVQELANSGNNRSVEFCPTDAPADLFTILGGTPDAGGIWTPALASGSGVFDPAIDAAGSYTYTVNGTAPCTSSSSSVVTVTIEDGPDAGINGSLDICSDAAALDLFDSLAGTPDVGGTWTPALASGSGVFNPAVDSAGIYTYTVTSAACGSSVSAEVNVTVQNAANAGADATADFCSTDPAVDLFTILGGTPDAGGIWTPALASGSGVFDPAIDAAGSYTYTVNGTAPCTSSSSSVVTVTIEDGPDAGINGSLDICSDAAAVDLFGSLGGTPDVGGTWTPALASGSGVFNPAVDSAGIYTYTVTSAACGSSVSAEVNVTVQNAANAGADATADFCSTDPAVDLFTILGGTPDAGGIWTPALASGSGVFDPAIDAAGSYTYTVNGTAPCTSSSSSVVTVTIEDGPDAGINGSLDICSDAAAVDLFGSLGGTPDVGGTWTPALASGSGVFNPAVDSAGIYTYTVTSAACGSSVSAEVIVTVQNAANAGADATADFCSTDPAVDLFTILGGTPDAGGTWTPALASGSGIFDPAIDAAGSYTYTVSGTAPCGDASSVVTVTIEDGPDAGINGSLDICSDATAVDLIDSLGGTPDVGGTWTPPLASGSGVFNPAVDSAGIYTYTVTSAACGSSVSAEVIVTVQNAANAGADATADFCSTDPAVDLITILGGTPDVGGTWSPALASGSGVFDPAIDAAGSYTYTVSGTAPCGDASSVVTVTIEDGPDAGINGSLDICSDAAAVDLFDSLGGTPDLGGTWTPALASGSGVFNPAVDSAGVYTYTVTSATCGSSESAEVSVTIENPIDLSNIAINLDPEICLGEENLGDITGLGSLTDGFYDLEYTLSGAIVQTNILIIEVLSGTATFSLDAIILNSPGIVNFELTGISSVNNPCGIIISNRPNQNFEIINVESLSLIVDGNIFCSEDEATLAQLSNNVITSLPVFWYSSPSGGTPLDDTTLLTNRTTYYAETINPQGCATLNRLAVTVLVEPCDDLGIIIPDGFSPNGDGINDTFLIRNIRTLYPDFTIEIYNRNGNVIFKGNANTGDWDGIATMGTGIGNGTMPAGVYFYILDLGQGIDAFQGRLYLSN